MRIHLLNNTGDSVCSEKEERVHTVKKLLLIVNMMLGVFLLWQSLLPTTAFAYIDPGTGSYLFQMMLAGLLSSLFAIKMCWRNIRIYLAKFFSHSDSQKHEND